MAALRAAGWRGRRPHPAASRVARWTITPPASLPAELPHRTTYPTSALLTAMPRREWRVDVLSSSAKPITSARGRDPVRWGGSRASCPAPLESGDFSPSRGCQRVRGQVCASTPRPAAPIRMPDTLIDAGILPAASMVIRMVAGFVFRGPPGRRGLRSIGGILPPTPCARWGTREPGVLARLPPHRAGSRPRADVTGFAFEDCSSRRHSRRRTRSIAQMVV